MNLRDVVSGCHHILPTAFSSMMPCALVLAADMVPGLAARWKKRLRNEMLGEFEGDDGVVCVL